MLTKPYFAETLFWQEKPMPINYSSAWKRANQGMTDHGQKEAKWITHDSRVDSSVGVRRSLCPTTETRLDSIDNFCHLTAENLARCKNDPQFTFPLKKHPHSTLTAVFFVFFMLEIDCYSRCRCTKWVYCQILGTENRLVKCHNCDEYR